jgi:hypothetical protein
MTDTTTVRLVVGFLGATILLCVTGGFWLAAQGQPVPEFLVGLGGTALGALGALLARTGSDTQPVTVVNRPSEPVPVEDRQVPPLPKD